MFSEAKIEDQRRKHYEAEIIKLQEKLDCIRSQNRNLQLYKQMWDNHITNNSKVINEMKLRVENTISSANAIRSDYGQSLFSRFKKLFKKQNFLPSPGDVQNLDNNIVSIKRQERRLSIQVPEINGNYMPKVPTIEKEKNEYGIKRDD